MRVQGLKRGVELSAICVILCTPAAVFLVGVHSATMKAIITLIGIGASVLALFACRRGRHRMGLLFLLPGAVGTFITLRWIADLVVMVMSHRVSWLMTFLDVLIVVALAMKSRKIGWGLMLASPMMWTLTRVIFAGFSFLYLMAPTSREYCEALEEQPGVTWFSGAIDPFFAADVHVLPGGQHIATSSKVWHDGFLAPIFAGHQEHKIVIMPASKGVQRSENIAIAQLPWQQMPQFLLADSHGNLVVTLIEYDGKHALGVIRNPTSKSPTFEDTIRLPEGSLANGLVEHQGKWLAIDDRQDILWIDPASTDVLDLWTPPAKETPFVRDMRMGFDLAHGNTLYLSTLQSRIFVLDLDTMQSRNSEPFGGAGGSVNWLPEQNILVVGDMRDYKIRLVDAESLDLIKERQVSYSVRPVRAAPDLNIAVAGDYIEGGLHAFRLDTLEPVGAPVYVGGNMRRIAYHSAEGAFYTASKCGVFKIDPKATFLR